MVRNALRAGRRLAARTLLALAALFFFPAAHAQDAAALYARMNALRDRLAHNHLQRPLVLESSHIGGVLKGDAYGVLAQPYELVAQSLQDMRRLCDILILPPDVKSCRVRNAGKRNILSVAVALNADQSPANAHQIDFTYRVVANDSNYLALLLLAENGPMGTSNYRIMLQAAPRDAKSSFVHLSYSYVSGIAARIATQAYLATAGRDKVGFSIVGRKPDGAPLFIGSERGMIERNTMCYYLAIEAYLSARTLPEAEQPERRLNAWYAETQRYPRQLYEMERHEYLAMKRSELAQQAIASATLN